MNKRIIAVFMAGGLALSGQIVRGDVEAATQIASTAVQAAHPAATATMEQNIDWTIKAIHSIAQGALGYTNTALTYLAALGNVPLRYGARTAAHLAEHYPKASGLATVALIGLSAQMYRGWVKNSLDIKNALDEIGAEVQGTPDWQNVKNKATTVGYNALSQAAHNNSQSDVQEIIGRDARMIPSLKRVKFLAWRWCPIGLLNG